MSRREANPTWSSRIVNTGTSWSDVDIEDLKMFSLQMTVIELAEFLCRSREEVFEKAAQLGVTFKGEGRS